MKNKDWWHKGLRFECQGSGKCCVSHGGYGHVYLTLEDRRRMAGHLGISTTAFTRKYCDQKNEVWKLKDGPTPACPFLQQKQCGIYEARPTQCRTWPFWPEVLEPRTWMKDVLSFCPGVGRGKVWSKEDVEAQLDQQKKSESQYGS